MQHKSSAGVYTNYMNRNPGAQRPFDDKFRLPAIQEDSQFAEIERKWKEAVAEIQKLGVINFPLPDDTQARNAIIKHAAEVYFNIIKELVDDLRQGIKDQQLILTDSASEKSQEVLIFEKARSYLFSLLRSADLAVPVSLRATIEGHEKNIFFNNVLINVFQYVESGGATEAFDQQYEKKILTYINNPTQLYPYLRMGGDAYFKSALTNIFKEDPTAFPTLIDAIASEKGRKQEQRLMSNTQLDEMANIVRQAQIVAQAQIIAWIKEIDAYIADRDTKEKYTRTSLGQSKEIKIDSATLLVNALASMLSESERDQLARERQKAFEVVDPKMLFEKENKNKLKALTHGDLGKKADHAIEFLRQEVGPKKSPNLIRRSAEKSTAMISGRLNSLRKSQKINPPTNTAAPKEKEAEKKSFLGQARTLREEAREEKDVKVEVEKPRSFARAKIPESQPDRNDTPSSSPTIGRRGAGK